MGERSNVKGGRSPGEVERDIQRTRAEMGATIDAMEEKLSPGQLIDQVSGWVKDGALAEQVREHPVPLALIGAGISWLLVENLTGTSTGRRPRRWTDWEDGRHPDQWQSGSGRDWSHDDVAPIEGGEPSAEDRAAGAAAGVKDKAAAAKDAAVSKAAEMKHRAEGAARDARRGFWDMLDDNPLAVGGAVAAVGFIAGLSAPSTRAEDRLMGDASSTLKDHAREVGGEAAAKAQRVARDASEAARREAERDDGRSPAEKAGDAAKAAAAEAKRSAERHDATPGRAKATAEEAVDETRSAAKETARGKNRGGGS